MDTLKFAQEPAALVDNDEKIRLAEWALHRQLYMCIDLPDWEDLARRGWWDLEPHPLLKRILRHLGPPIRERWGLKFAGICVFRNGIPAAPLVPIDPQGATDNFPFAENFQNQLAALMQKLEAMAEQPAPSPVDNKPAVLSGGTAPAKSVGEATDIDPPWPALEALALAKRNDIHVGTTDSDGNFVAFTSQTVEQIRSKKPPAPSELYREIFGEVTGHDHSLHAVILDGKLYVRCDPSVPLTNFPVGTRVRARIDPSLLQRLGVFRCIEAAVVEESLFP